MLRSKPKLKKVGKWWLCHSIESMGIASTPCEAYKIWNDNLGYGINA